MSLHGNYQTNNCFLKSRSELSGCMRSTCFCPGKRNSKETPEKFGSGSYFCLFGGLHFEQCMLTINAVEIILSNIDMSIIRTGALVPENHIKQACYCLQISLRALLLKLKDAKDKSGLAFFRMA